MKKYIWSSCFVRHSLALPRSTRKNEETALDPQPLPEPESAPPPSRARHALEVLCATLLGLLFLLMLATAAFRHASFTAPWMYELIRVVFVYLTGCAAIVAFARGANLHVPAKWKSGSTSYQVALFLLAAGLFVMTVRMLVTQGFGTDAASLLGLPEGTSHVPVALFGLGLAIVCAARIRRGRRA